MMGHFRLEQIVSVDKTAFNLLIVYIFFKEDLFMNRIMKRFSAFALMITLLVPTASAGYMIYGSVPAVAAVSTQSEVKIAKPAISLKVKDDSIILTVKKTENADGYLVYCRTEEMKKYQLVGNIEEDGTAARKYSISDLPNGTYYVKVRAYSGEVRSKYSKVKKVTVDIKHPETHAEILSDWSDDAASKKALVSYMEAITTEGGKEFIPVERRIAVFDLDGTLYCETDPNYFDHLLLAHRVLEDPDYKDKASDFEKKVAQDVLVMNETGVQAENMEVNHGTAVASSFKGFTPDEFYDYIAEYKKTPMRSYEGMTLGEAFYEPMLQIVEYLEANGFTVYVVSGTDRFIVRGLLKDSKLNIPNNHIIGSDETIVSSDQNGADGLNYVFEDDDKVVFGGDFIIKNLKMNKVSVIVQEIGIQPVLSFGNSTGDSSMAEYVTSNNPYRSLAFMLCCDDTERENGNAGKADKMFSLCEQFDWVPVSMKNDWKTIYGEGVTKVK